MSSPHERSHQRLRRRLAAGTMAVALLGVAACSDSDESPSGTTTTEAAASAERAMWSGTAPNTTEADDETVAAWTEQVEAALDLAPGVPGVWVSISHPELGHWTGAFGDAVLASQPATVEDHSRIGSITKTFTAVAVLQLVDEGELSFDDTVADVVPEVAEQFPPTADITIEQLLSMTSGLPDYANVPGAATAQAVADPSKVWTPEEIIQSALDASEVQPPGTPGYSTTNYTILGLMLEEVTGEPVEDVVTGVAEQAGLTQTALRPGDQNDMPDPSANGYIDMAAVVDLEVLTGAEVVEGTDVTDWSVSWGGAGGGMYSVIDELFDWTASAMGTTLLPEDLHEQRLSFDADLDDVGVTYGLGILQPSEGWVGHTGQVIGWEALGLYNPETGATMSVMINGTSGLGSFYSVWAQIFEVPLG